VWRLLALPTLAGLAHGVCRLGAHLGGLVLQERQDVGNERRPFETPQRANRDTRDLWVAAV
jgi:hypothetical protein